MDAAMIGILSAIAIVLLLAEFGGTLWDSLWRWF